MFAAIEKGYCCTLGAERLVFWGLPARGTKPPKGAWCLNVQYNTRFPVRKETAKVLVRYCPYCGAKLETPGPQGET
jgi:hypothetical protein